MFWCSAKDRKVERDECDDCTLYYECDYGYAKKETFDEAMDLMQEDIEIERLQMEREADYGSDEDDLEKEEDDW